MKEEILSRDTISAVFSHLYEQTSTLYLYAPPVNKYSVHASFLSRGKGKGAYLTKEDPQLIKEKLGENLKFEIISPQDLGEIKTHQRILIDGSSIQEPENEEFTKAGKGKTVLCTYDITTLNPKKIKSLVNHYDKLILSTDSATVLSSKEVPVKEIDNGKVDEFVKKELKTIVLALLAKEPMCGREIKLEIYKNFNILLSSGTLYPLLHELEKAGLLKCYVGIKTKTYEPVDRGEVLGIVNEHIQAKNFLNNFLRTTMRGK